MKGKQLYISRPNFKTIPENKLAGIIIASDINNTANIINELILLDTNYKIFIINHNSVNNKLNKEKLYNIGYNIAKENKCKYIIFQDVNTIPDNNLLNYYNVYPSDPISLSRDTNNILSISVIDFEFLKSKSKSKSKINISRLIKNNINLQFPSTGSYTLNKEHNIIDNNFKIHKKINYKILEKQIISNNIIYYIVK